MDQDHINFNRVAQAIAFIKDHFKEQPSLEQIARAVNLSPFHFQRLFTEWAGVSPKKFMQYMSLEYAKGVLKDRRATLLDTAFATGLSGSSRLHDLFVKIEGMTPGEYRNGGEHLRINYCFAQSPFGKVIVASTPKGICHIMFDETETRALEQLKARFPNASYQQIVDQFQQDALFIFQKDWRELDQIKLHLQGTAFQHKVWESLLKIPRGALTTYGEVAMDIGKPGAARAVGTAIGSNPVAYVIPCHRVIQRSGAMGGYRWGPDRKTAIIGWEAARHVDLV